MAEHRSQARKGSRATAPRALGKRRPSPPPAARAAPKAASEKPGLGRGPEGGPETAGSRAGQGSGPAHSHWAAKLKPRRPGEAQQAPHHPPGPCRPQGRGGGATPRTLRSPWMGHAKHAHGTQGQMGCLRPTGGGASPGAAAPHQGHPVKAAHREQAGAHSAGKSPPQTTRSTP